MPEQYKWSWTFELNFDLEFDPRPPIYQTWFWSMLIVNIMFTKYVKTKDDILFLHLQNLLNRSALKFTVAPYIDICVSKLHVNVCITGLIYMLNVFYITLSLYMSVNTLNFCSISICYISNSLINYRWLSPHAIMIF